MSRKLLLLFLLTHYYVLITTTITTSTKNQFVAIEKELIALTVYRCNTNVIHIFYSSNNVCRI